MLLLFAQLRGLATRARSAHLAEHCTIVSIGTAASLIYVFLATYVLMLGMLGRFGDNWTERSNVALTLVLLIGVTGILFPLWSLYLLVRFAMAFFIVARQLRGQWRHDDRAAAAPRTMQAPHA